jgi:hypothetical protein
VTVFVSNSLFGVKTRSISSEGLSLSPSLSVSGSSSNSSDLVNGYPGGRDIYSSGRL